MNQQYIGIVKWFDNQTDLSFGIIYNSGLGKVFFTDQILGIDYNLAPLEKKDVIINPRLMAAAKEFNIGTHTLVDFLVSKGYSKDNLKPNSRLTQEMYVALNLEFYGDKMRSNQNNVVTFNLSNTTYDRSLRASKLQDIKGLFDLIKKDTLEAINVRLISFENGLDFLFQELLLQFTKANSTIEDEIIRHAIQKQINSLTKEENVDTTISDLLNQYKKVLKEQLLTEKKKSAQFLKEILKIGKILFAEEYPGISKLVEENVSVEIAHDLWLDHYIHTCQVSYTTTIILNSDNLVRQTILSRCTALDKSNILSDLKAQFIAAKLRGIDFLVRILSLIKNYFPDDYTNFQETIEDNVSPEIAHELWLGNFSNICQINYISSIILELEPRIKRIIFERCTEDDKLNIFFKVIYTYQKIDTDSKLQTIKNFLNLSKEFAPRQHEIFLNAAINICPDYFKLNLWLEDYYQTLDFHTYKLYTITLTQQDQKKFVKKVLKYIHEEKVAISIEELTSINVFDYETSEIGHQIDESYLDYSTSILLNTISELHDQTNLKTRKDANKAQYKIYDLILKQIKEPKDILQITGYFDACTGRCNASVHEQKDDQGNIIKRSIKYNRNEYNKPKRHEICDGRKAFNKLTGEPILSEDSNLEFWWCGNHKCFKPSRGLHNSNEWEKYTLLDFLTILKVQYREVDLEIYLSIINKANHFLKHLKCRECNHILFPKGQTNYAFYGVSEFICKTENCPENGREIYLSHCLNGFCEMEIDSRDCVRCKPPGYDRDKCGWYICNYCHACCNGQQLEKRKWIYENINHKEYKCQLKGHKDLGIVSCDKCGDSMETNEMDVQEYKKTLNWLITNKNNSEQIYKSGKNTLDKCWFLIRRGNESHETFGKKLKRYHQLGFQIPDFDQDKDLQLISEPINYEKHNSEILTCKSCGNILDLSSDLERTRIIKHFHNVKFVNKNADK